MLYAEDAARRWLDGLLESGAQLKLSRVPDMGEYHVEVERYDEFVAGGYADSIEVALVAAWRMANIDALLAMGHPLWEVENRVDGLCHVGWDGSTLVLDE